MALSLLSLGPQRDFLAVFKSFGFALVAEWIPEKERGRAMGWVMSGFSLASVIGVPIGLIINDHFGYQWTFFSISILILLSSVACYQLLPLSSIPSKELRIKELFVVLGGSFKNVKYLQVFSTHLLLVEPCSC